MSDRELLELNAWCQALIDGVLPEADRARLEERLASSDEARRFYVRTMALSASLYEYAGEMQSETPDQPRIVPFPNRSRRWVQVLGSLAAAALVTIGVWAGMRHFREERDDEGTALAAAPEADEMVARITASKDGRWTGAALRPGDELQRGQQLRLASGVAEIAFDSGAVVLLEGPASLDITSAWEAVLHRGTLKAQVPAEAIGFRVSNADVEVVDLGTEFSMVADDQGATEVFVLKGAVETRAGKGSRTVVLREKEARRFARLGSSEVRDGEVKWRKLARLAALESTPRPLSFVHWSFDESGGAVAKADTRGFSAEPLAAQLLDGAVLATGGKIHGALQLAGGGHALASLSSAGGETMRTAAFWIQIPLDAPLTENGPVLAWALPGSRAAEVEISWNSQPAQGPLGALRTSVGRGFTIGSTPLRDGQWHHVAVVLTPNRRGNDKVQVRQYIDGRLDGIAARRPGRRVRGEQTAVAQELWIGRSGQNAGSHFHGLVDELFLINRALSPQEIQQLLRENRLPGAPMVALGD